jgi:hypothetical protein
MCQNLFILSTAQIDPWTLPSDTQTIARSDDIQYGTWPFDNTDVTRPCYENSRSCLKSRTAV